MKTPDRFFPLTVLFVFVLIACSPLATPAPTLAPDIYYTQAAETIAFQSTLQAGGTAVAELTRIAGMPTGALAPTEQPAPPTAEIPSPTEAAPTSTATPLPPTATPPQSSCDQAQLVQDVPLPNNGAISPGEGFTKVWQIQNIGACVWTPAYALVLVGGHASYDSNTVDLPGTIRPGDMVALTVDGSAPGQPGSYVDQWMLRNPQGQLFGSGADPFEVRLTVSQPFGGDPVLTWHRQGGANEVCDELNIYLNGRRSGLAVASSCNTPRVVLGSMNLSRGDLSQVIAWVKNFSDYNVEIYSAIPGGPPLQAYMTFSGEGRTDASNVDIQAMQDLAEALFNAITP